MNATRRTFLLGAGANAMAAAGLGTTSAALSGFVANAADVQGYKALVCVFLFGGMDCHDTLIPYDTVSHQRYAEIRAALLDQYGGARSRANLLPLTPINGGEFGGRSFALPPDMPGLHALFEQGQAAVVANVGPLIEPATRAQIEADTVPTPRRLFSHNDQQSTWMASAPEGAQFGWGGRFADAAVLSGANATRDFTTMTTKGNSLFLTGEETRPYALAANGPEQIEILRLLGFGPLEFADQDEAIRLLEAHFRSAGYRGSDIIGQDLATAHGRSFDSNALYREALASARALSTTFPNNDFGRQLNSIASAISIRDRLTTRRQVFFASMGGYDTHSGQAQSLPSLQARLDGGISAFQQAMVELGVENDVTLITASDFGRTLSINGDGTDHGWGAHHFVVGGAVQGRRIYGFPPPADFDHDWDIGQGRLVPGYSVEQFAEPLGRWFGLNSSELSVALPNLANFQGPPIAYI